ncbi:hypothetical protein HMPREF9151_00888 [Hoylesella saccharolytica F0055]|uniref:Uncharacterized protein n=1 Tax=Hoylesella saccharolytica F0055 TaxID=1127699 RepID=L1NFL5_9BACT|nr:hypothetical protein HMPREF9151_00888 [Hoylesella saccharolytica F0055]
MWICVPIMQCFVSSQQSVEFIFYDSLSSYTIQLYLLKGRLRENKLRLNLD